jgi:membrane carboxypeptidase/penicillin-binding protein
LLALSRNLVSVRLLRGIGIKRALRHIQRFGFWRDELPRTLSLALGMPARRRIDRPHSRCRIAKVRSISYK